MSMRVKVNNTSVNLAHDDTIVNLCDIYKVTNAKKDELVMV